jgi:hypothetical protein
MDRWISWRFWHTGYNRLFAGNLACEIPGCCLPAAKAIATWLGLLCSLRLLAHSMYVILVTVGVGETQVPACRHTSILSGEAVDSQGACLSMITSLWGSQEKGSDPTELVRSLPE